MQIPLTPSKTLILLTIFDADKQCIKSILHGSFLGVVVNMLDCNIIVNKFKLQLCYYVHFWTNTLGKGIEPPSPPAMG